jgi:hypothetical protein
MEAAAPAQAQGIFDRLFGGFRRMAPPPSARGYAPERDPMSEAEEMRPRRLGAAVTYCVRLCDGRYFPVSRQSGVDAKDICNSFCPAAQTAIYSGGGIDYAVAPNGKRYADLPNAFLYRDKIVGNCSCNGKGPLGLARADATDDPTLRTGDIVATNDGLKAVKVSRRGETEFTAIDKTRIYGEMRKRLSEVKVAPAARTTDGVASDD